MNQYELVVVYDSKLSPAKVKTAQKSLEKIIELGEGKVENVEEWGTKDLAYPIKKSESGLFLIYTLQLEPKGAKSLPTKLKMEDQIIRYLLIRKDK